MEITEEFTKNTVLSSLGNYVELPSFGFKIEEGSMKEETFLVDACVDHRPFNSYVGTTFTTTSVVEEAEGKWRNRLSEDNILNSYTCAEISESPNSVMTLTAFDQSGPEATVRYEQTTTETVFCGNCGRSCNATLTNDNGDVAYVCSNLSSEDQSLLIRIIAFPKIFTLITNDRCLGSSSSVFSSYSLKNGGGGYYLLKY